MSQLRSEHSYPFHFLLPLFVYLFFIATKLSSNEAQCLHRKFFLFFLFHLKLIECNTVHRERGHREGERDSISSPPVTCPSGGGDKGLIDHGDVCTQAGASRSVPEHSCFQQISRNPHYLWMWGPHTLILHCVQQWRLSRLALNVSVSTQCGHKKHFFGVGTFACFNGFIARIYFCSDITWY